MSLFRPLIKPLLNPIVLGLGDIIRHFTTFDDVAQTSVQLSSAINATQITMDVYSVDGDNTGLPTGAPAITAGELQTISFPHSGSISEIGRSGANYFRGIIANVKIIDAGTTVLDMPIDSSMNNTAGGYLPNLADKPAGQPVDIIAKGRLIDSAGVVLNDYIEMTSQTGAYKGYRIENLVGMGAAWEVEFEVVVAPSTGIGLNVYEDDGTLNLDDIDVRFRPGRHVLYANNSVSAFYFRIPDQGDSAIIRNIRITPSQKLLTYGRTINFTPDDSKRYTKDAYGNWVDGSGNVLAVAP